MADEQKATRARKLIGDKVLIVLAKFPNPQTKSVQIQKYVRYGITFTPFFSSKEALDLSTGGEDLGKPIFEIDRRLFAEIAPAEGLFIMDMDIDTEIKFSGEELKSIFPEPYPWDTF